MEKYAYEEQRKFQIMTEDRHYFIYAKKTNYRSNFLKEMVSEYPIKVNSDSPMAIYFDDFGLPFDHNKPSKLEPWEQDSIGNEYLSFLIARRLLEASKELGLNDLNSRLSKIFKFFGNNTIDIDQMISEMNKTIKFYYDYYVKSLESPEIDMDIRDIKLQFMIIENFVIEYKKAINNTSHLAIVLDKVKLMAPASVRAVNTLVGSRINSDISMKIAIQPNEWETYVDTRHELIQEPHDYGEIDLDNSGREETLRLKRAHGGFGNEN